MAIGTASGMQLYDDEFYSGFVETIQTNVNAFNGASGNAIRLMTDFHEGDYQREAFYDVVSSLVSRRDTTSVSAATDLAITSDEFVRVKLNRTIGPVANTLDTWRKITGTSDEREMSFIIGQQVAIAQQQEMLDRGLAACEAKLDATAALEHDATDGTLATTDLVSGLKKFGDAAGRIVAWVMHSAPYYDLVGNQITNAIYRANSGDVVIREGTPATLGRPVVVIDSTSLVETNGVSSGIDAYSSLGLTADAIQFMFSEPQRVVVDLVTGLDNLVYRLQGEYAYDLGLKGCTWDVTNGGSNPSNAAVATATNWDTQVADNKLLPGVIVKSR